MGKQQLWTIRSGALSELRASLEVKHIFQPNLRSGIGISSYSQQTSLRI